MNKVLSALSLGVALAAVCLLAGEVVAQAPPQISHTVAFPQGDATWAVSIQNIRKAPPANRAQQRDINRIVVERKGDLRRDTVFWTPAGTTEYWWVSKTDMVFFQTDAGADVRKMKASQIGARQFDASTFSWVSKDTFKGEQSYQGKQTQTYQYQVSGAEDEKTTFYAWIDPKTMRPVAWSDGALTATFTYDLPVTPSPLVMPEKIRQEVLRYQAYLAPPEKLGRQRVLK